MALVVKDRVRESSATTGTGSITLAGAYIGFQSFASALSDGSTVFYCIHNTSPGVETEWEVGFGTYSAGVLSRDTLYSSSTGSTVSFSAGTKEVFITYPSEAAVYEDNDGNVTVEGKITVGAAPTADLDVATKQYVDNAVAAALHYHDPVRLEHVGNLPGTYDNGAAGVGATLTNNSTQVALTADGVAVNNGDRVLFYEQTDATQNGVYVVTDKGSVSTNWVLTRSADTNTSSPSSPDSLGQGDAFYVQEGATAAGESYVCTTQGTITFGTTDITFSQFSATPQYTGTGNINVTGQVISLTGTVDETNGGTGISTYTLGEVLYASGATTLAQLPGNTTTTAKYLTQTGTGSVSAAPTWTALAASATTDTTNASNISSGTLPSARISGSYTGITGVGTLTAGTWNASTVGAAYGGTGLTSYTIGDLVYATGTTTIGKLADIAVGNVLLSGGVGVQPEYGKVGLTTHVSGVLPVVNGGTGQNTASGAINGLVPAQTGNSTKFLQTDGSVVSWQQPTTLYNSTNIKLATTSTGIDVTGTVVADGLEVNGGTANRVASFISTDASGLIEFADNATTNRPAIGAVGDDLALSTNGEKVRIDSAGNVGIGTSTPDYKLEVVDNASRFYYDNTTFGIITNTAGGYARYLKIWNSNASGDGEAVGLGNLSGSLIFGTGFQGDTQGPADSEAMRIRSDGNITIENNVGIGNLADAPATLLELAKNNGGLAGSSPLNILRFTDRDAAVGPNQPTGRIEWYVNDTSPKGTGVGSYIEGRADGSNGGGYLAFADSAGGDTGATESMRLIEGNLGIGTTSPAAKLAVVGGTSNASDLATAYSLAAFNIQPKSTSGYSVQFGSGPSDLPYIQMSAGGAASGDMTIQPYGGNVLVGDTSAQYSAKLYVNGAIAARNSAADGNYQDAFVAGYAGNYTEKNLIQTAVSSSGALSGHRFRASDGAGLSTTKITLDLTRDQLRFYNDGTERMRLESGNLGIGTTSPTNGKVEIQTSATTAGLWVQTGGTSASYTVAEFRTGANAPTLVVKGDNTVGINTTAPSGKFEVNGGRSWFTADNEVYSLAMRYGASTGTMYIGATNSATPSMQFSNAGGSSLATLDNSGNFTATGNVTAYSDERLKKDWEEVKPNFVDQLANVKSGTYTRTDSDERQAGVSAQSLQELLPETVMAGEDGMLSVAYGNAAMVAVVELAKEVRKLKEELRALKGE